MDTKYFSISFPCSTTIVISCNRYVLPLQVIGWLNNSNGVKALSGAVYNSKAFLYVSELVPDERTKLMAQPVREALI